VFGRGATAFWEKVRVPEWGRKSAAETRADFTRHFGKKGKE